MLKNKRFLAPMTTKNKANMKSSSNYPKTVITKNSKPYASYISLRDSMLTVMSYKSCKLMMKINQSKATAQQT